MVSYSEIAHYFESSGLDDLKTALDGDNIRSLISNLRNDLEFCGKKCDLCRYMIEQMDVVDKPYLSISSEETESPITHRWQQLTKAHRSVFELIGFALLLKMDATSMLIAILTAMSETERKILGKHAYTIVAEARNKDLFTSISARMKEYPEWVLPKELFDNLWNENKDLLKDVTSDKKSNRIRKTIDAHKRGFEEQLDAFKDTDWCQSAIDMIRLIQVVNNIEKSINGINERLKASFDGFEKEAHEYIAQLDVILKQLEELDG